MDDTKDPDQKKIIRLYTVLGTSLFLILVPNSIVTLISFVLFLGVLIIAYTWRTDSQEGSLLENHMTFIIRTIWISGFLAFITMIIASFYLFNMLDNTPLDPCIYELQNFAMTGDYMNMEPLIKSLESTCLSPYIAKNMMTFIIAGVMGIAPIVLYFIARFMRGFTRAQNGYRVANPRAWF